MKKWYDGVFPGHYDHIHHWKHLFKYYKPDTIFEFGVGRSTEFFLDHFKHVTSLEIVEPEWPDRWFNEIKNQISDDRWLGHFVTIDGILLEYHERLKACGRHPPKSGEKWGRPLGTISYDDIRDELPPLLSYVHLVAEIVDEYFVDNYDVAFVDPGLCIRGEFVQYCFGKVDVICGHDSDLPKNDVYGYKSIEIPDEYTEIKFGGVAGNQGTVFWIKNYLVDIIKVTADEGT